MPPQDPRDNPPTGPHRSKWKETEFTSRFPEPHDFASSFIQPFDDINVSDPRSGLTLWMSSPTRWRGKGVKHLTLETSAILPKWQEEAARIQVHTAWCGEPLEIDISYGTPASLNSNPKR